MSQFQFHTRPLKTDGSSTISPTSKTFDIHSLRVVPPSKRRIVLGGACVLSMGILYVLFLFMTLPNIDDPRTLIAAQSTTLTDRNGIELYRLFSEQDRTFIPGSEIPVHMKNAIIAIEDERFYHRGCIDIRAITRAVLANVFGGYKSQGASTIPQQLARTALLTRQKRITRKVRELMLACQLEQKFSKDELVELYLNWIPFGRNAYGIEQASSTYFGTSSHTLTLAQSVILAALPQRPSYFNPYGEHLHTELTDSAWNAIRTGAITSVSDIDDDQIIVGLIGTTFDMEGRSQYIGGRTDQVLSNMQELGFITETEKLQALANLESITFTMVRENIRAPHFVLWIREQVENLLGVTSEENILEQGGLRIETTLSWPLQERAESIVARHAPDILKIYGAHNVALVAMHPTTKEVLAYVGNTDFHDTEHGGKIDMARSPRQPGSSFKPFVYASAFQEGYGPATVLYDVPTKIGDDEPQNFDSKFLGPLTIRKALGSSRNIPAAKTFFLAGAEEKILRLATRMGVLTPQEKRYAEKSINPSFEYGWPLALGAAEVPLIEMVHGYSTFASQGIFKPLQTIRRITDKYGNILFEAEPEGNVHTNTENPPLDEEVLDPRIAYQITSILSDETARPPGYWRTQLSIPGFETAAKTGTSNKCLEREEIPENEKKDIESEGDCLLLKPTNGLIIGYTPNLVAGVWVGNADATSMYEKGDGLNSGSPFWRDFMIQAHKILASEIQEPLPTSFTKPDGMVQIQISTLSGELPSACTPVTSRQPEFFLKEKPPTHTDSGCTRLLIDKVTNLLASDECPSDAQENRDVLVPYNLLPERFPEWQEAVQMWTQEQTRLWYATPNHSGSLIPLPIAPMEKCTLALTPGRLDSPSVRILTPSNGGSATYPSFQPRITLSSSPQAVIYRIDSKVVATVQGTGSTAEPIVDVPHSISKNGEHTLEVEFVDRYFNSTNDTVRFRFEEDKNPPHISFLIPQENITLVKGSQLHLIAEASDAEGGIKYVQFFLGNRLLSTKPKAPYELFYTLQEDTGIYPLRATAQDLAGNTAEAQVELIVK
ncbi:transglycosylase domain-containing protein [Candidatus Peregrinibacteria bacterium]|nr:transglycosylase domain-containing protein [Candidatus Peregrinibacteria bacterium]